MPDYDADELWGWRVLAYTVLLCAALYLLVEQGD